MRLFERRRMSRLARVLSAFAAAVLLAAVAPADKASAPVLAPIKAHPALWVVHSTTATAYLFGSIHLLPPNVDWHSPAVDAAIAASDVFVFEAPLGEAGVKQTQDFVRANGMLPDNKALASVLAPRARRDYEAALAESHLPPETVAHMRPWLAAIVLETKLMESLNYSPDSGVDRQLWAYAKARQKPVDTFETVAEQLSLLMPANRALEAEEFDASLRELGGNTSQIGALVDAWCEGRIGEVAKITNEGLSATPGAMKLLISDRNLRWYERLSRLLATHKTYFVTVGAGHLAGPKGLAALLAARGYRVSLVTRHR